MEIRLLARALLAACVLSAIPSVRLPAQATAQLPAVPDSAPLDVQPQMVNPQRFRRQLEDQASALVNADTLLVGRELPLRVRFVVRPDSTTHDVEVVQGSGVARVDSAAVHLIRRTRFVPGQRDGAAVSARVVQPLRFIFPEE